MAVLCSNGRHEGAHPNTTNHLDPPVNFMKTILSASTNSGRGLPSYRPCDIRRWSRRAGERARTVAPRSERRRRSCLRLRAAPSLRSCRRASSPVPSREPCTPLLHCATSRHQSQIPVAFGIPGHVTTKHLPDTPC